MSERDLFTAARAITDPAARAAYLDQACGGDAALRKRIERLLRADSGPDSLLDTPERAAEEPLSFLELPGRPDSLGRLGHYEVLEVLGKGGFGIVFRAFDETLHRVVAVKVLAPLLAATSPARKRFLREAQSSAAVRHENVVQVHAVEETPLPYLVMELPGRF
jgi:serine/threonine protein kinase